MQPCSLMQPQLVDFQSNSYTKSVEAIVSNDVVIFQFSSYILKIRKFLLMSNQ